MAVPVGIMLSSAIGGPVAQAYGWRVALTGGGDPGLVLVPAVLWLQEPERSESGGWRRVVQGRCRAVVLVDRGVGGGGEFRALQLLRRSCRRS